MFSPQNSVVFQVGKKWMTKPKCVHLIAQKAYFFLENFLVNDGSLLDLSPVVVDGIDRIPEQ